MTRAGLRAVCVALAACAPFAATGCLPGDTRTPPAEVTVTATPSPLTLSGIPASATADGFAISFDRFVVNLGDAELGNGDAPACNVYSNPDYTRTIDFEQVDTAQELGLAFATGSCPFDFGVRTPNATSILGHGVDQDDVDFLRTAGSDPDSANAGVSVYVEGSAVRGDERKHFAWPFRKRVAYHDCGTPDANGLELAASEKKTIDIAIRAEALFEGDPATLLHFEPFANADADGDGEITFDELWSVDVGAFTDSGLYVAPVTSNLLEHPCFTQNGGTIEIETLGDYAYCVLLPQLAVYQDDGACSVVAGRGPSN